MFQTPYYSGFSDLYWLNETSLKDDWLICVMPERLLPYLKLKYIIFKRKIFFARKKNSYSVHFYCYTFISYCITDRLLAKQGKHRKGKKKERNSYISYDYFIAWINKKYSKILIPHPPPFKEFAIRPTLYRFYFYNCFIIAQTVDLKEFKHDVQQKKIGIYYNHMCKWVSKWKH